MKKISFILFLSLLSVYQLFSQQYKIEPSNYYIEGTSDTSYLVSGSDHPWLYFVDSSMTVFHKIKIPCTIDYVPQMMVGRDSFYFAKIDISNTTRFSLISVEKKNTSPSNITEKLILSTSNGNDDKKIRRYVTVSPSRNHLSVATLYYEKKIPHIYLAVINNNGEKKFECDYPIDIPKNYKFCYPSINVSDDGVAYFSYYVAQMDIKGNAKNPAACLILFENGKACLYKSEITQKPMRLEKHGEEGFYHNMPLTLVKRNGDFVTVLSSPLIKSRNSNKVVVCDYVNAVATCYKRNNNNFSTHYSPAFSKQVYHQRFGSYEYVGIDVIDFWRFTPVAIYELKNGAVVMLFQPNWMSHKFKKVTTPGTNNTITETSDYQSGCDNIELILMNDNFSITHNANIYRRYKGESYYKYKYANFYSLSALGVDTFFDDDTLYVICTNNGKEELYSIKFTNNKISGQISPIMTLENIYYILTIKNKSVFTKKGQQIPIE